VRSVSREAGGTHVGVLDGKVALVTGAGRGIGRGIALAFASAGADVAALEVDPDTCATTAKEIGERGRRGIGIAGNVRLRTDCFAAVQRTTSELGPPTILVNSAIEAISNVSLLDHTDEHMIAGFESGTMATFWLMQACAPIMAERGGGSIINFGSGLGTFGAPGYASYAAAKEAIRALTRVAAHEWGHQGIRVNVICPFANSPGMVQHAQNQPDEYAALIQSVPLERIGDCEQDMGSLAVFLASDAGSYLTANTIMADGGSGVTR
jgi:NAD(P)-dependent dehydrogenase (short-subunit alcohol dehydrogenase family)